MSIEFYQLRVQRQSFLLEVDLKIATGEWCTVIGPSGSGKSTLVQATAGLLPITSGKVRIAGIEVNQIPPHQRGLGVVFQESMLFSNLSIRKNFILAASAVGLRPSDSELGAALEKVSLPTTWLERKPTEVSGGERARLNLAAVLLQRHKVLILDEAFAALDVSLRWQLHEQVEQLRGEFGWTLLSITHQLEDALAWSDTIFMLESGRAAGSGSPKQLCQTPPTLAVAKFLRQGCLLAQSSHDWLFIRYEDLTFSPRGSLQLLDLSFWRVLNHGSFQRWQNPKDPLQTLTVPAGIAKPEQVWFDPQKVIRLPVE